MLLITPPCGKWARTCSDGNGGRPPSAAQAARRVKVSRPLFRRYVFVAFDPDFEEWFDPIMSANGVIGFVKSRRDGMPMRIPSKIIDELMRLEANGAFDDSRLPVKGVLRRVVEGPFAGQIGPVLLAMKSGRIKVEMVLLGQATPFEFDNAQLEPV